MQPFPTLDKEKEHRRPIRARQRDENRSHRFAFRSAARTGNARDGNRKIRAEFLPRAAGAGFVQG